MKMKEGTRGGIFVVAALSVLVGGFYGYFKPNSRDRVLRYLKDAKTAIYETNVGNCKVTVKGDWGFLQRGLYLTIENDKNLELTKLELKDYSNMEGRFRGGLDYIVVNGETIDAEDISKDTLKHYEKIMDKKLSAIEPGLKELAAKLKLQYGEKEREDKTAREERATKLAEQYKNSLPNMCSE